MDEVRRNAPGYEEDFVAWLNEQARLLREGDFAAIDRENVAEELESLGRSDKREIQNRLLVLLTHLLKQRAQPERAGASWAATIAEQRRRIVSLVAESPSLRPQLPLMIAEEYALARLKAASETRKSLKRFPEELPFTEGEIFGEEMRRVRPKR